MPRLFLTSFQKTGSYRVVSHLTSCTLDSSPEPPPSRCCSALDFLTWSKRKLPGPQQTPSCLPVRPAAGSGRINSAMALTFSCLKQTKKHFFSSFQSANSRVQVECVLFLSQRSLRCVLFIVTARVVLEGLWDSFALLVVTTKALLSAVALTWILKLLEFGLVKKSFPMVYFTTFSCFR